MDKRIAYLIREAGMSKIRGLIVLWGLITALLFGFLAGMIFAFTDPSNNVFWCVGAGLMVINAAGFFLARQYWRQFKVINSPGWADKVKLMRRQDDGEHYPFVAAAIALEKTRDAKRRSSDARHGENRALKAEVLAWWDANKHTGITKDAAAEQMAGKVVPIPFATVRKYLKGI